MNSKDLTSIAKYYSPVMRPTEISMAD